MCGILGSIPATEHNSFDRSLNSLAHRGPDGYGIWHDPAGYISLGHRRLSIIDLRAEANQPMEWNERYLIVFNGEIYNYIELRRELEKKGIKFRTNSDTEVLIALYATEGVSCLNKLNGMWAFAIFDKQDRSLFLSRDRMGEKPLYYINKNSTFFFASEMKALYPFLDLVEPNEYTIELAKEDMFSYESTEHCLIKGISRFPAASYGYYRNESLEIKKYWVVSDVSYTIPKTYEEQVEKLKDLFIDSCRLRMRSDVQIGTALSGGVDSSATISTMSYVSKNIKNDHKPDWQHAYIASFPGSFLDETKEAKKVADFLGVNAEVLEIDPIGEIENLFYNSYLFEEFYITPPIPFIQLYRKIKEHGTTVTLDGHGSDELFGGYPFDIVEKVKDDFPNPFKLRKTLQTIEDCKIKGLHISYGRTWLEYKKVIREFRSLHTKDGYGIKKPFRHSYLNDRLYRSSFVNILPTLLRNYDRYSMINGVEIRMPFLDHRIVEFAFLLPQDSKVRGGYSKAIVRDAMKGFFPDDIRLLKRKIGFNAPFSEWLRGPLKVWIKDIMASRSFTENTLIDAALVKSYINELVDAPEAEFSSGEQAWMMLMPYVWSESLKYAK